MPSRVPYSERCARCDSARKVQGSAYCLSCKRIAERSIAVPGRDVAAREPYPEREQERDLKELSSCSECGAPYGGHALTCSFWQDLDFGNEYREAADAAEMDA